MDANTNQPANGEVGEGSPRSKAYGRVALRGMVWMQLSVILSQLLGFCGQFVLGWKLFEKDYRLFALATSVASILVVMRDGGLGRVLIQRGREYQWIAAPIFQVALIFNILSAATIVGTSHLVARLFGEPGLPPLLYVMALTLVFSTPATIFRARLLIDLQFGREVGVTVSANILKFVATLLCAFLGLGALSLVIPMLLVVVFEGIAFGRAAGFVPNWSWITMPKLRGLLRNSSWIMLSTLAGALVNQGDYLIIGLMEKEVLGVYTFGFMLSAAFATLFGGSVRSVLMSTLSRLTEEPQRFAAGYVQSVGMLSFVLSPLCVLAALLVPPLIDLLWRGKWNETIPVVQLLLLSTVFRILTPVALATFEARGRWTVSALLLVVDGLGTLIATAVGSWIGGLVSITMTVSVHRAAMSLLQAVVAGRIAGLRVVQVLHILMPPILLTGVALLAAIAVGRQLETGDHSWFRAATSTAVFVLMIVVSVRTFMPARMRELLSRLRDAALLHRT